MLFLSSPFAPDGAFGINLRRAEQYSWSSVIVSASPGLCGRDAAERREEGMRKRGTSAADGGACARCRKWETKTTVCAGKSTWFDCRPGPEATGQAAAAAAAIGFSVAAKGGSTVATSDRTAYRDRYRRTGFQLG